MQVKIDTSELAALARAVRSFDGEFQRVSTAASPLFSAGGPNEAVSLLSFLRTSSSWALAWADNLDRRVDPGARRPGDTSSFPMPR